MKSLFIVPILLQHDRQIIGGVSPPPPPPPPPDPSQYGALLSSYGMELFWDYIQAPLVIWSH